MLALSNCIIRWMMSVAAWRLRSTVARREGDHALCPWGGNWNGQNSVRRQEHPFVRAAYPGYNAHNTTPHGVEEWWRAGSESRWDERTTITEVDESPAASSDWDL